MFSPPATVFLDHSTQQNAVRSRWGKETRTVRWGDEEFTWQAPTLEAVTHNKEELQREREQLPAVAELARQRRIRLYTGREAQMEAWGWRRFLLLRTPENAFRGLEIRRVPDPFPYSRVVSSAEDYDNPGRWKERRDRFFERVGDKRMAEIREAIGIDKALDAYHLRSAEGAGLDYFLTFDGKLINKIRNEGVRLAVEVVKPSELLARLSGSAENPPQ